MGGRKACSLSAVITCSALRCALDYDGEPALTKTLEPPNSDKTFTAGNIMPH